MKVGKHNVMQLKNGDWVDYRVFDGYRYLFHTRVYLDEKKRIEKEKTKLRIEAAKKNMRVFIRVTKGSNGWDIWVNHLVGRMKKGRQVR